MDAQTEYLIKRNHIGRIQIQRNILILLAVIVISHVVLWYFVPTSAVANLPYCVTGILTGNSERDSRSDSIVGVFIAHIDVDLKGNIIKKYLPYDTHLLRFDPDGQVIYAPVRDYGKMNWRQVSIWFNWNSANETILRGEYKINGNRIGFATAGSTTSIEWSGRIELNNATQQKTLYLTGPSVETFIFNFYNVDQCPFTNY